MSADGTEDARNPESDQITVLHVEDDPAFAELTATFLHREDETITVTTASNASEALDTLEAREIDCIVSDYDMPGQNGIEFLGAIREEYADIPFILFTGKGSEEVASKAFSAGATDYLQKGHNSDQYTVLANRVRNYAEKYSAEQERDRRSRAMKTVDEGIAIVDRDGRFIEVNEAFAAFYGVSPVEMIGEHWTVTVTADEAGRLQEEVMLRLEERGTWTGETVGRRVDGSTYPIVVSIANLDAGGHVCTVRDVTEQKERDEALRQLKEEFETVFNTAQEALFLYDVVETEAEYEFELRRLNPAHEESSGLSSDELRGATPREILGEEQGAEVAENLRRCVEDREPICYEEVLEMPSGTIHWRTQLGPVVEDDEVIQIVGVAKDITEQKERERKLSRQNERLDEFDTVLTNDLRKMMKLAEGRLTLAQDECDCEHLEDVALLHNQMRMSIGDLPTVVSNGDGGSDMEPADIG